ncbi:glycosyltransferase family 4 protein [Singulisphaera sp. PoT]|uniref:glycosyltransferase family 4 protein n=1 Tax=Singulisphaera sp. PoT TaxID=3411797 RepID=UPI003BF54F2E
MLTTFFGTHSFGGDAAFVDRLSRALARQGHEVHVIHCRDAFEASRGDQTPRPYEPPPGVVIHPLESRVGTLSPLATHQTGYPFFKAQAIKKILRRVQPDVVHFHNLSLIGGPGLLKMPIPGAVKFMTAHEHWLVCPQHVLWKFDERICEREECIKCCAQAKRPPQLWRRTSLMRRSLAALDALICPSQSTLEEHARRGIVAPMTHLPYFLPHDYTGLPQAPTLRPSRPYIAAAGRLEKIKGFQDVIDVMKQLPGLDLRIAGSGQYEDALRYRARGLDNVRFEGRLDAARVAALFRGARAVVVPSLVFETFGYVVLEAFAERCPVIVRDLGALPGLVEESDGGLVFNSPESLVASIKRLADDDRLRRIMGENGHKSRLGIWSEEEHLDRYFALIEEHQGRKRVRLDRPHSPFRRRSRPLSKETASSQDHEILAEA